MPTASVNGINLYYEEHGQGEPLLLIMGFTAHSLLWFQQVPVLSQHYRVITFDNRGVGRSDVPPGPYAIRQMADDAAGLLDHLGVERAHVIGWSMGGMIAQELALSHPRKVGRLVLLASLAHAEPYTNGWITFTVQSYSPELDLEGRILMGMPWVYTPALMTQPAMVQAALAAAKADPFPTTQAGVAAQAEACRGYIYGDANERIRGIAAPTLVLVGAEDILTPPAYSKEMAERIPGARLQVLERGGHGVPVEYPQDVNDALLAFFAETAPSPVAT